MLLPDEYTAAEDAIVNALATGGDVRALVMTAVKDGAQCSRLLTQLPLELKSVHEAALGLLNICITDQFASSPCWLEAILIKVNVTAQSHVLQTAIARLQANIVPESDAFQRTWLNRVPFFDRARFRPLVRALITTLDLPVLRVNGPQGCGCSYTTRALEEIARKYGRHITVLSAEIPASQATVYSVEDLVEDLLSHLPGALPLPQHTGSSYPSQLVRHTINKAVSQSQTLVFVIDGAGLPGVSEEISLFIAGLAKGICKWAARPRARLVLINHRDKLVLNASDMGEELVPDPAALQETDLECCLEDMEACRIAAGRTRLPASAKEIAKQLLSEAPSDPKARLAHLNGQLVDIFGI